MYLWVNCVKTIIEKSYRIESEIDDVNDYLINDALYDHYKDSIVAKVNYSDDAQVIVFNEDETTFLGIYFSDDFRQRFEKNNPRSNGISSDNIDLLRIVIEEVDHLIKLEYHINNERQVSLLELELQANVTKYLGLVAMIAIQEGTFPHIRESLKRDLKDYLFNVGYAEEDPEVKKRYELADVMGRAFVESLDDIRDTYTRAHELRSFYRQSLNGKMQMARSGNIIF